MEGNLCAKLRKIHEHLDSNFGGRRKIPVIDSRHLGGTFAFALMIMGLASTIVLIDVNAKLAEGQGMDLKHGLPFVQPSRICSGTASSRLYFIVLPENQSYSIEVSKTLVGSVQQFSTFLPVCCRIQLKMCENTVNHLFT